MDLERNGGETSLFPDLLDTTCRRYYKNNPNVHSGGLGVDDISSKDDDGNARSFPQLTTTLPTAAVFNKNINPGEKQVTYSTGAETLSKTLSKTLSETSSCLKDEKEKEEDEVGGWMSSLIFDSIKPAVYHLLNLTIKSYRKEQCYGCKISHPSEEQHKCQEMLEDYFIRDHYYSLMKRLITPRFIPSIQYVLINRRLTVDNLTVQAVAETLLHEVKSTRQFYKKLLDVYKYLTSNGEYVTIRELLTVSDHYSGVAQATSEKEKP